MPPVPVLEPREVIVILTALGFEEVRQIGQSDGPDSPERTGTMFRMGDPVALRSTPGSVAPTRDGRQQRGSASLTASPAEPGWQYFEAPLT